MSMLAEALYARGGPLRYAGAGLINSAAGYAVILLLGATGAHPYAANAGGFAAGFLVSLVLAQLWTFGPATRPAAPVRYVAGFGACYCLNLVLVASALSLGGPAPLAQALGVAAYAGAFYLTCRWWVYGDGAVMRSDAALSVRLAASRPGLAVTMLSVPIAATAAAIAPNPSDVVWQMWIARQLNGGADLYSGIIEINPPLWFWMAMPIDRFASLIGLSPLLAVNAVVAGLGVIGVALCAVLTRGWGDQAGGTADRLIVLFGAVAALLVLPVIHFAQREHIVIIGTLPYLLLTARRIEGRPVSLAAAAAVGALAAAGFALKHYFVLLPVAAELWRLWRGGAFRAIIRTETVMVGLAALAYGATVLIASRDFLTEIVPFVAIAYGGYEVGAIKALLLPLSFGSVLIAVAAFVGLFVADKGEDEPSAEGRRLEILLIGALVFLIAYALQAKGFVYHLIPAAGLALIIGLLSFRRVQEPRLRCVLGALTISLGALAAINDSDHDRSEHTFPYAELGITKGTPVLALTPVASLSLTALDARGAVWTSRSLGLWPLVTAAMATSEGRSDQAALIVDVVAAQVAEDARCNPPDIILADTTLMAAYPSFEGGVLGQLSVHPASRDVMAAFTLIDERGALRAYARTKPLAPPLDPARCRTIH